MRIPALMPRVSVPGNLEYPSIDPVPERIHRPFWSVMIPTYNRTKYLKRTLKSVLEQDPGPDEMQIEVIDNQSTEDGLETLVRTIGEGRVSFYRQPTHVSVSDNWTTCITRAHGRWVHILHDDDMVMRGFYANYKRFIEEYPAVVMAFCRAIEVDENDEWVKLMDPPPHRPCSGIVEDAAYRLVEENFICAPTAVAARDAYVKMGGFASWLHFCADWEMWMRLAGAGSIGYIHQPRLLYRVHPDSGTDGFATGAAHRMMTDIVRTIDTGVRRLPAHLQQRARTEAYKNHSGNAHSVRNMLRDRQQYRSSLQHALWMVKLEPSVGNLLRVIQSTVLAVTSKI